jgi:hypothetical protein
MASPMPALPYNVARAPTITAGRHPGRRDSRCVRQRTAARGRAPIRSQFFHANPTIDSTLLGPTQLCIVRITLGAAHPFESRFPKSALWAATLSTER